jgi:hypothetical protein
MPKATVDEDRKFRFREDKIRLDSAIGKNTPMHVE